MTTRLQSVTVLRGPVGPSRGLRPWHRFEVEEAALSPRLLLLIVAYNAESTLTAVLDRIPRRVLAEFDCEVLVIDDASTDRTFEQGLAYRQSRPDLPLRVLRNGTNLGYGGNQKVGYRYAIEERFDFVALIHGDGQYAPEELPRLLEPLLRHGADAVLGSRMLERGAARRGGMPRYKLVGNKILSRLQNALAGARLSEWHSGFRLYRVSTLASLHYTANSDGFGFDTDIILQLLSARASVVELPIPTYYGDEICRVAGLRYARDVLRATARYALHRLGVRPRYDLMPPCGGNHRYDVKLGYPSSHSYALDRVHPSARVLDLGAGPGVFAGVVADKAAGVDTADIYPPEVHDPRVSSYVVDLNRGLDLPMDGYDQVLLLDVLEHLADPERFVEDLSFALGQRSREVIVTTPNVAFVTNRVMLLLGQFNYGGSGILDRTHTRLFTFASLRDLLARSGFTVTEMKGIPAPFPKVVRSRRLANLLLRLNQALIAVAPRLFSYQVLVVARSRPHVAHLLAETKARAGVVAA